MTDWHVGMQVVCVEPSGRPPRWQWLERGRIYTIREIDFESGEIGFLLEEILNPINQFTGGEYGYRAYRFRPVRKTNIDCFLSLLNKTPTEREVAATTSLSGVSSLPDDLPHERACQLAKRRHLVPSAAFSLRPNLAPDLPFLVDGRVPLSHPSVSSGDCLSAVPKNSTRGFQNAGKCFQKTGK